MFSIPDLDTTPYLYDSSTIQISYLHGKQLRYRTPTAAEKSAAMVVISDMLVGFISARMNIQVDNEHVARKNAYTYVSNPNELIRPPDRYSEINIKEGVPFKDFKKRKAAGEILMSDYKRAHILVKQSAGFKSDNATISGSLLSYEPFIEAGLIVPVFFETINGYRPGIAGTNIIIRTGMGADDIFMYYRKTVKNGHWSYHDILLADTVLSSLDAHKPEFTSLVTNVLAKANRSSVDVLTAFAELPKSIGSLLRGFKLVAHILKDAKKGEFNINKAYALRKKRMTDKYRKRLARIDGELRNKKLSASRRAALQRHRDEIYVGHREYLVRSADELASELANLWLNYRYNIMPNVYLAQDIYDAIEKYARQWITASGTIPDNGSVPVGPVRMDVDGRIRILIKRSFSKPSAKSARTVMSADLFVTAWELVPLSFVYDWFVNVGDFLSAQSYNMTWTQSGSTVANTLKFNTNLDMAQTGAYTIEPITNVKGFYYKRLKINPQDHCGLVWQPTMGLERKIDALALIWRPVRSLLLQGKRR